MALAPGAKLGPYEILAPIGKGGMGEVYRAKDARLKREVAVKVLPEAFASNPERMARFQREAEVLALLNHPNIATIYGVEERALVMELVEGDSPKGPMPFDQAWKTGLQIIDALEYAHDKGVVHRDLKPANVKVTPEGVVKLLDFGLAKAFSEPLASASPDVNAANSPTMTMEPTVAGVILGTPSYMSPEQARGKPVDQRADIWAFGVMLYELLTGEKLFHSEDTAGTLAQVLTKEPDLSKSPAPVRKLLERCLEKDPKKRLRDIGEARFLLEASAEPARSYGMSRHGIAAWAIAGLLAIVAVGLGFGWWRAARPVGHPLMRLSVDLGPDALVGNRLTVALPPDGTRVVFLVRGPNGTQQLAERVLDQRQVTLLSGTEDATDPFFSPDGEWIGFFADGKLKKVSVHGGATVTLCDAPYGRGASWGEDGNIILTPNSQAGFGLSRIPSGGGTPETLTKPSATGEVTHRWPQILPGGEWVLFTGGKILGNYDLDGNIEAVSLKTREIRLIQRGGYFGRYLGAGYLAYIHQGTLFAVPFDLDHLQVKGNSVPLLEDVAASMTTAGGQFDYARNGTLVYLPGKSMGTTVAWLDNAGETRLTTSAQGSFQDLRFSPDGTRLAFTEYAADIWVYDLARDANTRLTFTGQVNRYPVWTPDGKHIVFHSQDKRNFSLEWIRADGAGETQPLFQSPNEIRPFSFSPDGKRLAFDQTSAEMGSDIWTIALDPSQPDHAKMLKPDPFLQTRFNEWEPAFSPDGHWIAYSSDESGKFEVYVRAFSAGASGPGKWQISAGGGRLPKWSRNKHELFYEAADDRIMVAEYEINADSFTPEKARPWSNIQLADISPAWNYDLAPDGKRFAVLPRTALVGDQKESVHVTFLLNFFDEVRRRIPIPK